MAEMALKGQYNLPPEVSMKEKFSEKKMFIAEKLTVMLNEDIKGLAWLLYSKVP